MIFGQANLGCIPNKDDVIVAGLVLWNTSVFGDIADWKFQRVWMESCASRHAWEPKDANATTWEPKDVADSDWTNQDTTPIDISRC